MLLPQIKNMTHMLTVPVRKIGDGRPRHGRALAEETS